MTSPRVRRQGNRRTAERQDLLGGEGSRLVLLAGKDVFDKSGSLTTENVKYVVDPFLNLVLGNLVPVLAGWKRLAGNAPSEIRPRARFKLDLLPQNLAPRMSRNAAGRIRPRTSGSFTLILAAKPATSLLYQSWQLPEESSTLQSSPRITASGLAYSLSILRPPSAPSSRSTASILSHDAKIIPCWRSTPTKRHPEMWSVPLVE